jgi:hypothetical protein
MTNEAFARVKIDALLAAQGWNSQDPNAVRYEVVLPDSTRADYVLCDRHGRAARSKPDQEVSTGHGAGKLLIFLGSAFARPAADRPGSRTDQETGDGIGLRFNGQVVDLERSIQITMRAAGAAIKQGQRDSATAQVVAYRDAPNGWQRTFRSGLHQPWTGSTGRPRWL